MVSKEIGNSDEDDDSIVDDDHGHVCYSGVGNSDDDRNCGNIDDVDDDYNRNLFILM